MGINTTALTRRVGNLVGNLVGRLDGLNVGARDAGSIVGSIVTGLRVGYQNGQKLNGKTKHDHRKRRDAPDSSEVLLATELEKRAEPLLEAWWVFLLEL